MILDLAPALRHLAALERQSGFLLDDEDLFSLIFKNMRDERTAMQDIEQQLLCVALDSVVDYDDLVMGSSAVLILNEIRKIAQHMYREIRSLGMFRDHRFDYAYHSRPFPNAAYFIRKQHHAHDYSL